MLKAPLRSDLIDLTPTRLLAPIAKCRSDTASRVKSFAVRDQHRMKRRITIVKCADGDGRLVQPDENDRIVRGHAHKPPHDRPRRVGSAWLRLTGELNPPRHDRRKPM